jgi:hypothetical protein
MWGHHLPRCPEDERTWELAEMRIEAELEASMEAEGEEAKNEEPFDAVSEIMANFVSIYGRHDKETITIR